MYESRMSHIQSSSLLSSLWSTRRFIKFEISVHWNPNANTFRMDLIRFEWIKSIRNGFRVCRRSTEMSRKPLWLLCSPVGASTERY